MVRLIAVVFEDEVDVMIGPDCASDRIRQFCENVRHRVVDNGVNRVQPETIEMIFSQPVERIVDEEITDHSAFWTIEVDAVSPRRGVSIGKELWRVRPEVISLGAKMVVDHIQQNHDAALMSALNQLFQIFRPSV